MYMAHSTITEDGEHPSSVGIAWRAAACSESRCEPPLGLRAGNDVVVDGASVVIGKVGALVLGSVPRPVGAGAGSAAVSALDTRSSTRVEGEFS